MYEVWVVSVKRPHIQAKVIAYPFKFLAKLDTCFMNKTNKNSRLYWEVRKRNNV